MQAVPTGSAEFDLLCQATRPKPDLTLIRDLLRGTIDYPFLAALALGHGVRPQLFRCLDALSWENVPESEKRAQQIFRQQHLVRTLTLSGELDAGPQGWSVAVRGLAGAYPLACLWPFAVGIYLLMRRDVDSIELDEVTLSVVPVAGTQCSDLSPGQTPGDGLKGE